MQDLFSFTSSAKILSCDLLWSEKKRCQDYVLCCGLDPASRDCDQSARQEVTGSVVYSRNSFPQEYFVRDSRKVCSHIRGGLRQGRHSRSPADNAQAWGIGHFTATSILGGRSQAQTLKTQPEPGETQQQLIYLHCEAVGRRGEKKILQTTVREE